MNFHTVSSPEEAAAMRAEGKGAIVSKWGHRFIEYDRRNPEVYTDFVRFTFIVIRAGRRCGAQDVLGRIRWETLTEATGDRFKINQNYGPYYARKFMRDFPKYKGFFLTKERDHHGWILLLVKKAYF